MAIPNSVKQLIEPFGNNLDFYKSKYNEAQLAATDRQIDHFVYKLYNLTEDEIALVGGEK